VKFAKKCQKNPNLWIASKYFLIDYFQLVKQNRQKTKKIEHFSGWSKVVEKYLRWGEVVERRGGF